MNNYQQKYLKILNEIEELEGKQEELISMLKFKEEEKKTLEEKHNSLTKKIDNLQEEKDKMLNVDYDDYVSCLGKLLLCTVIMALIFHYKTYEIVTSGLDKIIYYIFLCGGTVLLCGLELNITAKYINKRNKRINNSDKYKNLLEGIKISEIERENISKKQSIVAEEYLNVTLNYSAVSASLKIKKEILEDFKNEVFGIIVGNLTKTEEKPLTKARTRKNLNNKD